MFGILMKGLCELGLRTFESLQIFWISVESLQCDILLTPGLFSFTWPIHVFSILTALALALNPKHIQGWFLNEKLLWNRHFRLKNEPADLLDMKLSADSESVWIFYADAHNQLCHCVQMAHLPAKWRALLTPTFPASVEYVTDGWANLAVRQVNRVLWWQISATR